MLWLRKTVFYIFTLIYLIICPLIVARMLGFVVNPVTHRLVKTGLVYVSTNPPDALVYIDGSKAHQHTPTVIRDLTPGKHFIRIEMNGYNDWERDIPIVGKKATVLANILLIPESWPIREVAPKQYQNIIAADDDIVIATNPQLKDIGIFHTTQDIEGSLKDSIYRDARIVRLSSAPQSPFILVEANLKDRHKFLWIDVKENPPRIEDISDLFVEIPIRIAWDNANNDNVFAFYPGTVYRINIKDKAIFLEDPAHLPQHLQAQDTRPLPDKYLINDKNDLLVRQGGSIKLYPKEDFDTAREYTIARIRPSTDMYFEEKTGELFYLDHDTGHLFAAQILPYHPTLNIPIPDALRFKTSKKEIEL